MITETPIASFKNKVKINKTVYPQCDCGKCSQFYWNAIFCGARGAGKTVSAVQQIQHYEQHKLIDKDGNRVELRTCLISPTIQQNEIFKSLKSLDDNDTYDEYSDDILLNILDDVKRTKEEAIKYQEYDKVFKKYSKLSEDELDKLNDDDLYLLQRYDFEEPSVVFPDVKYKFAPVNIIILDDLLGSDVFSKKSKSIFQNALIKSRHMNVAYQILVQSLRAVPKPVRLNCSVFWIGKFAALKVVLDDIYPEVSGCVTEDQLAELYKYAIDKPYGSLIIDTTKPKECWFSANWDKMLTISN